MISQEPIFTVVAALGEIRHFGRTPYGERRVVDILGGRVDGPRLKGRILPANVASLVLFLASDDGSLCTGHEYWIDAGWR